MSNYITIKLSKTGKTNAGKYTTIVEAADKELAELNWNVLIHTDNLIYARRTDRTGEKPKVIHLHREVMERMLGHTIPDGYEVDHINGNGLDNRRENLRLATHVENMRNSRKYATNTSGYRGVSWDKRANKWRATISVNGKVKHHGRFNTPESAYQVVCAIRDKLYGDFANNGDS